MDLYVDLYVDLMWIFMDLYLYRFLSSSSFLTAVTSYSYHSIGVYHLPFLSAPHLPLPPHSRIFLFLFLYQLLQP